MSAVGAGVQESRIREDNGAFRVTFVSKFADAIFVLHCFQQKTRATSRFDIEIAAKQYRELRKELHK